MTTITAAPRVAEHRSAGATVATAAIAGGSVAVVTGAPRLALNLTLKSPRAATQVGVLRAVTRAVPFAVGAAVTDRLVHSTLSTDQKGFGIMGAGAGAGLLSAAILKDVGFGAPAAGRAGIIQGAIKVAGSVVIGESVAAATLFFQRDALAG